MTKIGYLCIQKYPKRICGGCTSACDVPVYVEDDVAPDVRPLGSEA